MYTFFNESMLLDSQKEENLIQLKKRANSIFINVSQQSWAKNLPFSVDGISCDCSSADIIIEANALNITENQLKEILKTIPNIKTINHVGGTLADVTMRPDWDRDAEAAIFDKNVTTQVKMGNVLFTKNSRGTRLFSFYSEFEGSRIKWALRCYLGVNLEAIVHKIKYIGGASEILLSY